MKISLETLQSTIGKKCIILPFENIKGTIVAAWITTYGLQYEVRYYINSKQEQCYFLPEELDICY